jgi:hypothetical protein
VDIDAELAVGAPDAKGDGTAFGVLEGVGHQFAGQQDRDVGVDGDGPGADEFPDPGAGLGRCGWPRSQPETGCMQSGRAGRRHPDHRYP